MAPILAEPSPYARGLASSDAQDAGRRVLRAWEVFREIAAEADLDAPSRLPGWTARDVCVHLGSWDDAAPLQQVLGSARAGGAGPAPDADAANAAVVRAHRGAGREEVLAALERARDGLASYLSAPGGPELATADTASLLGPLPVLTVVHAGCYELAVHALDLAPAGAPAPPVALLLAGLGALLDCTGALAARAGLATTLSAQTPEGGWAFRSAPAVGSERSERSERSQRWRGGWVTGPVPAGDVEGVAILGTAADVLDVSAGRAQAPALLAARRLRVQDLRGVLALAPLIEGVPGLPGGAALRGAARTIGAASAVLGRLPRAGFLTRRP